MIRVSDGRKKDKPEPLPHPHAKRRLFTISYGLLARGAMRLGCGDMRVGARLRSGIMIHNQQTNSTSLPYMHSLGTTRGHV